MSQEIISTNDGSHTLVSKRHGTTYHSRFGAITESKHVFIQAGLLERLPDCPDGMHVLEIGLGTGLNALLTQAIAQKRRYPIRYSAIEAHPVPAQTVSLLNYPEILELDEAFFRAIHEAKWEEAVRLSPFFSLRKIRAQLEDTTLPQGIDVVYFDAFAPNVQPELWTDAVFQSLYDAMNLGAVLVTYSAKGSVRRTLQAAGFNVEKLPGPPGKREMLRARKV